MGEWLMNGCAHVGCGHDSRQEARSEERVRKDEIGNEILSDHVIKVLHRLCGMRATLGPGRSYHAAAVD